MKEQTNHKPEGMSRRDFLGLAAMAALLSGCSSAQTAVPTPTATPTQTITPTATAAPQLPEIVKFYPEAPSRVVRTHHAGVWDGRELVSQALRLMLDASITQLTGLDDAVEAWSALFKPKERIAIKVNTLRGSNFWTHVPLVIAIAESLQEAGVPAEQIIIYDRDTSELENADFPINPDGSGVRCHGTDYAYTSGWKVVDSSVRLSEILLSCDALINVPVLKEHSMSGASFAMKNHYGTFDAPERYHHGRAIEWGIAELNALSPIKDRARLIIGDALAICARSQAGEWNVEQSDSISMSFDPVAHDTMGLRWLIDAAEPKGLNAQRATDLATPWLKNAVELGVGTNDPQNIETVELNLG
jgi:hypothetical protein